MFRLPSPQQQVDFAAALAKARAMFLQEALGTTVETLPLQAVDNELAKLAPKKQLGVLARHGLRGELIFAVPTVLEANPRLLGYYRLLLGYSQKEFYTTATGASRFKSLEFEGRLNEKSKALLVDLCRGLNAAAGELIEGIGPDRVTRTLLDDLTLLTLGPQFRGGANVRKGDAAILKVFEVLHRIVRKAVKTADPNRIEILNAARRTVLIEFAADPDIVIRERMTGGTYRNVIAIEIKGGTDFSNIHNRIGEAEKSHQKARAEGFTECWTVVNVSRLNVAMAHRESPSTNRFYRLGDLLSAQTSEFAEFKDRVIALSGIRG